MAAWQPISVAGAGTNVINFINLDAVLQIEVVLEPDTQMVRVANVTTLTGRIHPFMDDAAQTLYDYVCHKDNAAARYRKPTVPQVRGK